jgi:Integrase zinc binding domain
MTLVVTGGTDMKHTLLRTYHDGITAGHPGMWKTYASLLRSYWWPTLKPDVMTYVKGCAMLRLAGLSIARAYIWQYCTYVILVHWMPRTGTP